MSKLDSIPVEVAASDPGAAAVDMSRSVLSEIHAMLEALIASGRTGCIDLQRQPLAPQDHARLRDILGRGELAAELDCLGPTRIMETAVSGVWWITHYREDGRALGEFIEVTTCPDLLVTPAEDLPAGPRLLGSRLSTDTQVKDPAELAERVAALGLQPGNGCTNNPKPNQQVKRGNGRAEQRHLR